MTSKYKEAGVDINRAEKLIDSLNQTIEGTFSKAVLKGIGGFAGFYSLDNGQVLVSATDGVGTKLDLAISCEKHDTVGTDLVAMVVNDIICHGAKPLFFLDYIATSKINEEIISQVIKGIGLGCGQAGCALIGGETAEMPGFYPSGKYDLAGFAVGIVDENKIIDGHKINPSDVVLGINSSGLHSNGFSLVRKIIKDASLDLNKTPEGFKQSLGKELLAPTRIYVQGVLALIEKIEVQGLAHITGGGLIHNLPRILPENTGVKIDKNSWQEPPIFGFLKEKGNITKKEMYEVFNAGIGMAAIIKSGEEEKAISILKDHGLKSQLIGEVVAGNKEITIE